MLRTLAIAIFALVVSGTTYADVMGLITKYETTSNIPAGFLKAIVKVESSFKPQAINNTAKIHSYGLAQLTKFTADLYCSVSDPSKLLDAETNLRCGSKYLSSLLRIYRGNTRLAAAAYNVGTACTCRSGRYLTTENQQCPVGPKTCTIPNRILNQGYVDKVMKAWER
jgi:soluble lytic murein transglycosylase-like protein